MDNLEKLLEDNGGEFTPLRVGSRKFYRKWQGVFYPHQLGKCIENHREPYVALVRPMIPIGIGNLDLRYPNWWLAVGVAERFCSKERIRKYVLAVDLPPLILKYQPLRRLSFLFTKALSEEDKIDFALGKLYKLKVDVGVKVSLEKTDEFLKSRINLRKLKEFVIALKDKGFMSEDESFVIITQEEFDKTYKEIYSAEIENWRKLKEELEKERKAENEQVKEDKKEIAYKEERKPDATVSFEELYSKYENLADEELEPPEDYELPEIDNEPPDLL